MKKFLFMLVILFPLLSYGYNLYIINDTNYTFKTSIDNYTGLMPYPVIATIKAHQYQIFNLYINPLKVGEHGAFLIDSFPQEFTGGWSAIMALGVNNPSPWICGDIESNSYKGKYCYYKYNDDHPPYTVTIGNIEKNMQTFVIAQVNQ